MNKWKIAFWACAVVLLLVTAISTYTIINQGVTITYMKEGYTETESDLGILSRLINETDLSKTQIREALKGHRLYQYMDFTTDTISLNRIVLIFKSNKLVGVTKQW